MKKILRSLSLCMALLLIFQLLIPFSVLAEGTLTPSLSMNSEGTYTVSSVEDLNTLRSDIDQGIAELQGTDQAAADAVIAQIEALALPADLTIDDQSSVEAARAAYAALSEAQKELVTNLAKLTAAEATLAELQGTDQAAADAVIAQIEALASPTDLTIDDQSSVEAARAAYAALSEAQKELVTNLAKLTAAEATLAESQVGVDTTPPVITITDLADQTLSEGLAVAESSFSFQVTAQDEQDGTISPSVQLNGTVLEAGSDGINTCTLSTGSNTITVTATDSKDNEAEQSLKVTLNTSDTLTPSLSTNSEGIYTVGSVEDLNTLRSDIDKGIDYSNKAIILTQDIDLSKAAVSLNSFTTKNTFNGCFDGKSHTISGYTDAKSGLFSLIDYSGYVRNLRLEGNVVISDLSGIITDVATTAPSSKPYGLIANESAGTISRCSTTGTVTNNVVCQVAGIAGYSTLKKKVDGKTVTLTGKLMNCFSNVVFNNQAVWEGSAPILSGISYRAGDIIEHCYFYGQFTGNTLDQNYKRPIKFNGGDVSTCAYDNDVLGFDQPDNAFGAHYTTEEMKTQASYTALGFDFDKYWSIDPTINNGYPYLDPLKEDKEVVIKISVDIQVSVADKTYDSSLSEAENLNAVVNNVQIANPTPEMADLIARYDVKVDYTVNKATLSSRMGEWPVTVSFDKLELTYTPNDVCEFTINKVLPTTAKYLGNGQPGPTEAEQVEQVALAKRAQDILYSAMKIGQGAVPAFTWRGDKATAPGKEGTIEFVNDPWEVFSAVRSGYTGVRPEYYDDWFQSVQTGLQTMKEAGIEAQDVEITQWEKLVLAITAIGYDPRDIKAYDLIDIISNKAYLAVSHPILHDQYAVLALNSYNYSIPNDGNRIDKDALIHGWAAEVMADTPDLTDPIYARAYDFVLMQQQPIAAYYNPNAQEGDPYYDVKVAVEMLLAKFSVAQTDIGYFYSGIGNYGGDINPWNNAQVYMTLGMANVNPFDARYIKNGYSMFDAAFLVYYDFKNGTCSFNLATYEPGQMGRGLDSLVRAYEGRNNIFDCTDVLDSTVLVNNAIAALPETITSANKAEVEAAQALYNALSDAKKASLQDATKAKLVAAQLAIGGESDQAIADTVIAKIAALPLPGAIILADQSSIQAARAAYTALNEAQEALVTNLAILTAAEARLAELQGGGGGGDTTPPVITVKNLADQALGEALTVAEPSFSFKVTAQDEKDGTISPSVQLNGTALTAGTDGSYTCTLSTGSNTITVTATDAAGNKAEKSLNVTLGTAAFTIERVGNETFKNGQEARLKVKVSNQTASSQDAILIVALYRTDGGNKMVNYAYISKTIKAGEQEELGSGFPVPESGTYTIKGFVWNNLEDMKALMAAPVIVDVAQS
ncbi:MAG TPA: Ig-like domain-containing protein [Desulfosporosinus sp.]|nr:Ig-like domain-containing protein [Desulfosporosinus sp.]